MNRLPWLAVAALLLSGCGGSSSGPTATATEDAAGAIRTAAQAYSDAFLTGDGEAAYALLSKRCQDRTAKAEFVGEVESAGTVYGDALPFDTFDAEVNGNQARVTYTYADNPEINQDQEPWVREGGQWLEDDC